MYYLFWTISQDANDWQHEVFDNLQGLSDRREALRQSFAAAVASSARFRVFHFPDPAGRALDIDALKTYLAQFGRYEILPGAGPDTVGEETGPAAATDRRYQVLVRVGAKAYQLGAGDSVWLAEAIAKETRTAASEEFLQLAAPDAIIVAMANDVPVEYELYDNWTTLADLVNGHWPFPQGAELLGKIQSGAAWEIPADTHGAD